MSEAVKRYDIGECNFIGGFSKMLEDEAGEWVYSEDHDRIVAALTEGGRKMQAQVDRLTAELDNRPTREQYEALDEKHNREGLERARQSIELVKIGNERDQLAEQRRELEKTLVDYRKGFWNEAQAADKYREDCDTLRAEVERLTALQLPPDHLPMPRRMLELLIGDPQDPYRANAESVASEMLSGALPDPTSYEREFSALRNVRLLLSEIDRLRAELNTRPGPGMRLCTACKAYHPAENFDPGMACCRAANERNPVYFVRLPDGSMEMHHKDQEAGR